MSSFMNIFVFCIYIFLLIRINQSVHHYSQTFRKHRHIFVKNDSLLNSSLTTSTTIESIHFFQNEPIPLAASVVDDLTTLASAIYIICLIVITLIILAWITHYNAPCSSVITSILSTITGLPEPIIHSVALCGSCCLWCERTWLFRRIHQFNIWISSIIQRFVSGTCKIVYDNICPCCRPPDTPSNRSLIGSLPANIIGRILIPDTPKSSPPKPTMTLLEPTSIGSRPLNVNDSLYSQTKAESLIGNQDYLPSRVTTVETRANTNQTDENESTNKKRRKQSRRKNQLKQRATFGELSSIDIYSDDTSEDDNNDQEDEIENENIKIY